MQEARGSKPLSSTGKRAKSILVHRLSAGLVATASMRHAGEPGEDGRRLVMRNGRGAAARGHRLSVRGSARHPTVVRCQAAREVASLSGWGQAVCSS
jgi:hypothetical protein